ASDYVAEARQLNPLLEASSADLVPPSNDWVGEAANAFGFQSSYQGNRNGAQDHGRDAGSAEPPPELDWTRDETGILNEPGELEASAESANAADSHVSFAEPDAFRFSDTLVNSPPTPPAASKPAPEFLFSGSASLPSDTMSSVLRDELEGIDFYIGQGYLEIAQDTLERLRAEYGEHPEIMGRFSRLGGGVP